jgi:hypothetical protein
MENEKAARSSDRGELAINVDELINDLDRYIAPNKNYLSKDEEKFIRACRERPVPLNFVTIASLWNNKLKWRHTTPDRLRHSYDKIKSK